MSYIGLKSKTYTLSRFMDKGVKDIRLLISWKWMKSPKLYVCVEVDNRKNPGKNPEEVQHISNGQKKGKMHPGD